MWRTWTKNSPSVVGNRSCDIFIFMKNKTKTVDINRGYFKQGDDFGDELKHANGNVPEALRSWSRTLTNYAGYLNKLASAISGVESAAQGDTHYIGISLPRELADELIKQEMVQYHEFNCGGCSLDENDCTCESEDID